MVIKIKYSLLERAIKELELNKNDLELLSTKQKEKTQFIEIDCNNISVSLLSFFMKNSTNIANKTKAELSTKLLGENIEEAKKNEIWETKIYKLADIIECFSRIGIKKNNSDVFFIKSWYPVITKPSFVPASRHNKAYVDVSIKVHFGNEFKDIGFVIQQEHLLGIDGKMKKPKLRDLFEEFGCRPQKCNLAEYNASLLLTEQIKEKRTQMRCKGYGIKVLNNYHRHTISSIYLGNNKIKERVIIEPSLEYEDDSVRSREVNISNYVKLPFVRIFSFIQKEYAFVDVNNLEDYFYDNEAHNRIFLPSNIKKLMTTVFASPVESLVGDIVDNKHGGMIILAYGNPGVGKTSTAEVYSEMQQMPLYPIEVAELGTSADNIEKNLNIIFRRVENWNAIVLFDEIDVFLAKREKEDLNRTAIVGVFLRLMDYFKGVMFLTSNRPEVLDYAISSRITLKVKYPDLDQHTRKKIWEEKLKRANIRVNGTLSKVHEIKLNGREIRNMTRLAKIVYPTEINQKELIDLIEMSSLNVKDLNIEKNTLS